MSFDRKYKYLVGSWSVGWTLSIFVWTYLWDAADDVGATALWMNKTRGMLLLGAASCAFTGWVSGIMLRRAQPWIGKGRMIAISAIWVIGSLAAGILPFFTYDLEIVILNRLGSYNSLWTLLGAAAVGGAIIGGGMAAILLGPDSPWGWKLLKVLSVSLSWSILFVVGSYSLLLTFYLLGASPIGDLIGGMWIALAISGAFIGTGVGYLANSLLPSVLWSHRTGSI